MHKALPFFVVFAQCGCYSLVFPTAFWAVTQPYLKSRTVDSRNTWVRGFHTGEPNQIMIS